MKGKLSYSIGRTLQTANFESVRIDVALEVEVDGNRVDWDDEYGRIKRFVDNKVEEEESSWRT